MYDYALIIHPTSEESLYTYEPGLKNKPRPLIKKLVEWSSPFTAAEINGLNSHLGRTAKGALIMCPLLPEHIMTFPLKKVIKSVVETIEFTEKALSPKLIGLTAYIAFSSIKSLGLAKVTSTPLTTGANYTLAMIPESILRAVDFMGMDLSQSYVLVVGATSNVGRYCIEILSYFVPGMFITAHNEDSLGILLSELPKEKRSKLHTSNDISSILDKVNIVIIATNRIPQGIDVNRFNPGTVVFDASYPRRIPARLRDDILVIDGVAIKPPGNVNFNFDFGLPAGLCYPCMAETIVLALEKKYENYSFGKEFNAAKIKQILRLGAKHGFEISGLTSQEKAITNKEISEIKNNSRKKRSKLLAWR
jgi:predicted amino acid dehydrogenase